MCDLLHDQRFAAGSTACGGIDALQLEASGCILASQVPHETTVAALARLTTLGLLPYDGVSPRPTIWKARARRALSGYRFPTLAAERLARLAAARHELLPLIRATPDVRSVRRALLRLRCGLGPKQASLFLRNVSQLEVAVLDVHMLTFMRLMGLSDATRVPSTLRGYEELEARFLLYARGFGQPASLLDLAVWIVMRARRTLSSR